MVLSPSPFDYEIYGYFMILVSFYCFLGIFSPSHEGELKIFPKLKELYIPFHACGTEIQQFWLIYNGDLFSGGGQYPLILQEFNGTLHLCL